MFRIVFKNLESFLQRSGLSKRELDAYRITIRWYFDWCRRSGVAATVPSAREFVAEVAEAKRAPEWLEERWKDALRWLFASAPVKIPVRSKDTRERVCLLAFSRQEQGEAAAEGSRGESPAEKGSDDGSRASASVKKPTAIDPLVRARELMRVKHKSLKTERAYLGWMRRFINYRTPRDRCARM